MGRIRSVYACEVFGCIRSLATFRLPGGNRDYLIVGSDSGRIVILFYDTKTNAFYKVHQETFGRDNKANLTISSPLEAHKSHHVLHHVVGMDCGFDNPIFAVLEVDHGGKDPPRRPNGTPEFKKKSMFFILAQTEYGDLMKITLEWEGTEVKELKIKYLDTIDPCVSICILKSGFLYAASEDNFAPITDMRVENVTGEETPQIYAVCGRATKATLRVLRPGLAVTEMAVSPLPGRG
eukprot:jgi/Pico_ML_1/52569/g3256.t1